MGLGVFLFAVMVETLQYFNLVQRLHLQGNKVASIIMGTTFDWSDLLAYFCGIWIIWIVEFKRTTNRD